MATTLETLLVQIRDGTADPATLGRARALVQVDERIPPELRGEVLCEPAEAETDAVGLLAMLGADDDLGLAAAVREEAGAFLAIEIPDLVFDTDDGWEPIGVALREGLVAEADGFEIADAVVRRLPMAGFSWGPVLADAVAAEGGSPDLTEAVFGALEQTFVPVSGAIAAEAGEIDVVAAVMAALAADLPLAAAAPVADAVRAEAGSVDVVAAVMAVVDPVPTALPRASNNNRGWSFGLVVMAAVALLTVSVGRLVTPLVGVPESGLMFAHAGDVVVEDLSYADNVQVFQTEGDQGAVILWLDEEA
jgi:hypothetical protein